MPPVVAAVILFYVVFLMMFIGIFVVAYIFTGLGVMGMLRKLGFKKTWYAFVPFCNAYALGYIADQYDDGRPKTDYAHKLLRLEIVMVSLLAAIFPTVIFLTVTANMGEAIPIALVLLLFFIFIGAYIAFCVICVIYAVQSFKAYWRTYRIFMPKLSILFLMLTIFASPSSAVIMFILRNKEPQNLRVEEENYLT